MPHITANGLDIHYERTGQGPRLLFISGTGGDLRVRPNMLDGPFARTFDLVAYDQRGLGQTEKPDRPYAMADYADDAAGLMDALGWEDALVIGVSFGGMVAQNLIVRHPQRVRRLVLACTSSRSMRSATWRAKPGPDTSCPSTTPGWTRPGRRPIPNALPRPSLRPPSTRSRGNRVGRWAPAARSRPARGTMSGRPFRGSASRR